MRVIYVVVVLLLLASSCARRQPETPVSEPQAVATQPGTPQPAAKPAAPRTPPRAPAAAPAPSARAPVPPAAGKVAPPAKTPAPAPTLDLTTLEAQLRATKAIGIFTKITLKNQIDDLLDRFREYHQRTAKLVIADLRRSYDLLLMKVLSLLQDGDPQLAMAIVSSRAAIWNLLADPVKFATLKV